MNDKLKKPVDYREHFRTKTIEELVEAYNRDRGTSGWVTARGCYVSALKEALLATGLDCSSFIGPNSTLQPGQRVAFDGVQFVAIGSPIPTLEADPALQLDPMGDSHDAQFLIDALIRSMEWGNDAKIRKFGEQLVGQWVGAQGAGEDGVFRPFDELEDPNLLVELLDLSTERAVALEAGGRLTRKETASLADAVDERYFQADGTSDYWDVARIESANGHEAYVAQTIQDGDLWGWLRRSETRPVRRSRSRPPEGRSFYAFLTQRH